MKFNKEAKKLLWQVITAAIIIAMVIGTIVFIYNKGWFQSAKFGDIDLVGLFDREPDTGCTFVLEDDEVCIWDNVTGNINANSPSCYIGYNYNNEGWRFAGIINETSPKFYKESRQATVLGHYEFAAICGTPTDFCRTNNVEVDVIPCDDEEDDNITYTCGWVGEQCGGTCPSTHPLCVDMWIDTTLFDEGYAFCACINPDDETVHPDWKPDGQYHDDTGPEDEEDFPNGEEDETIGTYCINLGFDKHWDTYSEGNCIQGAINECGTGYEYHWNDEKTWCCYKCVLPLHLVTEDNLCGWSDMKYFFATTPTVEYCQEIVVAHCASLEPSSIFTSFSRDAISGCCGWDCE